MSETNTKEYSTKPIIKDTLITSIPQIVAITAGIITSVLLARGLGVERLGEYTLIISIATLVPGLSDLGINQSAIRFASQAANDNDKEAQNTVLRWAFRIRMLLLFLITLILFIFAPYISNQLWHIPHLTKILRLSLLIGIFTTLAAIPTVYFQSLKKFKTNALVQTLQTIISTSGIILIAIINKWSVGAVIISSIVAAFFSAVFFFHIVPKQIFFIKTSLSDFFKHFFQISKEQRIKDKFQKEIHSFTFYLIISSIICTVSMKLDIYLMGYFLDTKDVGLYSVVQRMLLPLTMITTAFNTQLWPKLASSGTNSDNNKKIIRQVIKPTALISVLFAMYAIVVPLFIPFLFGSEYSPCILLTQILALRYVLDIIQTPFSIIGYNYGFAKKYTVANFVNFVDYALIYIFLLPIFGIWAVAIGKYFAFVISIFFIWTPVIRNVYFKKI